MLAGDMSGFDQGGQPLPLHQRGLGIVVTWGCRLLLLLVFAGLVSFAFSSVDAPACGPWPKPDRWPSLLPALVASGVTIAAGCFLVGRYTRLEATGAWFVATAGTMGALLGLQFFVLLYMSFTTLC